MEKLPSEMKMNIIARLPVKSIARCKLLSNAWYNLLSGPSFLSFQLTYRFKKLNLGIVFVHKDEQSIYYLEPSDIDDTAGFENSTVVSPFKVFDSGFVYESLPEDAPEDVVCTYPYILGACNGFICISMIHRRRVSYSLPENPIWVVNPITEQRFQIPDYSRILEGDFFAVTNCVKFSSGLGFEESSNQFKLVIIIFYFSDLGCTLYESVLQVHTLGSDNWSRKVGVVPEDLRESRLQPVFVNGCLLWLTTDVKLSDNKPIILSFNLSGEEFGNVLTPDLTRSYKDCHLGVFGESLCILESLDNYALIWIMHTYNVQESWIKRFSIRKDSVDILWNPFTHVDIIKFCENGELLLLLNGLDIIAYDLNSERSRYFEVRGIDVESRRFIQGFPFVGSLLSLT